LDAICLIAAPQAGTERLCEVTGNIKDLAVYRGVFSREEAEARERPGAALDALEAAARDRGKRFICFPLFRGELPLDLIEREVTPRGGLRLVMVVRKQIDNFVEWRRSVELGRLDGIGAGAVKVKLDADTFADWLDAEARWYEHWRTYLERRFLPCPILRYETDINQPAERVLRRFCAAADQVGIMLRPPAALGEVDVGRIDEAAALVDRVANWAEFNREIFARGLERRAFGYPI
jgi:hypothetical protein